MVERILVEKIAKFDVATKKLKQDIKNVLGIEINYLRRILRYDTEGIEPQALEEAKLSIFSEPPVDVILTNLDDTKEKQIIIVEFLDGQYDQRADSAAQCVQLLTAGQRPLIRCATIYVFSGLSNEDFIKIKKYLINPVDSKEGSLELPKTLKRASYKAEKMRIEVDGFIEKNEEEIKKYYDSFGFAMNIEDLLFVQNYFKKKKRNPSLTELKVIDTYWSDHCRHTTFLTEIIDVKINSDNPNIEKAYKNYQKIFKEINKGRADKYPCLMDLATIAAKKLKAEGYLKAIDQSEEINACSVNVQVDNDGAREDWLIMFKNETHNHPTEIEPFGGAATCLGGAIRDPLSGRSYVYQAMRITGAGNPLEDYKNTLKGKLPQRVLTKTALSGFSSYGNQIGLATGIVRELYNDGFKAKRLETGYVIGGALKSNVIREKPAAGDVVILVGGDTGRDGCGGATGSSKAHNLSSIDLCGAEVQKGNAPEERKLQRLFKREDAAKLIIRSNDFGAGGVSVAIGELSEGLDIYLDRISKKYEGLSATELAISESQERMAVVVHKEDVEKFIKLCKEENLKAAPVAAVTSSKHLKMFYNDEIIVDLERKFLDTNGVAQKQKVTVDLPYKSYFTDMDKHTEELLTDNKAEEALLYELASLKNTSQKGMGEVFDSTIGASTVLMPFGGKTQLTPSAVMASKPPVSGFTHTVTCSSYGIDVDSLINSPYNGAIYSVVLGVSKLIASGVSYDTVYLTLQEFFKKLYRDEVRWGEPFSALLGAFDAQINLKIGAIGGKDSMSGSFENIDVPPTLIAFSMGVTTDKNIIHNAFPTDGYVYRFKIKKDEFERPVFDSLIKIYRRIEKLITDKVIIASAVEEGNFLVTLAKSLLGNRAGIKIESVEKEHFLNSIGDIICVSKKEIDEESAEFIGSLNDSGTISAGNFNLSNDKMQKAFLSTLNPVFPIKTDESGEVLTVNHTADRRFKGAALAKPRVFIPVFPGTNCEFDTKKAFEKAGADVNVFVINNGSAEGIEESIREMTKIIQSSQIIAFPGGFSGGDEPDGSGKFIATAFRNPALRDAVLSMLNNRDGLAIGICNGFQALIKLGLLPFSEIEPQRSDSATLTFNTIARHVSTISKIRIASNRSPWLNGFNVGDIYSVPVSHGEGKFIASPEIIGRLIEGGQIATQYVDDQGFATMESPFNPNGSTCAIEGIVSPYGRIFGKMGHAERYQEGLYQNVEGNFNMEIFKNGVNYFK